MAHARDLRRHRRAPAINRRDSLLETPLRRSRSATIRRGLYSVAEFGTVLAARSVHGEVANGTDDVERSRERRVVVPAGLADVLRPRQALVRLTLLTSVFIQQAIDVAENLVVFHPFVPEDGRRDRSLVSKDPEQ